MNEEVVVTRKGQTTIPTYLRKKYGISEGTRLNVEDSGRGILFKKVPNTLELIGSGAKFATVKEMKKFLDEMRAEKQVNDKRYYLEHNQSDLKLKQRRLDSRKI